MEKYITKIYCARICAWMLMCVHLCACVCITKTCSLLISLLAGVVEIIEINEIPK